jgi:antitoxin CptB
MSHLSYLNLVAESSKLRWRCRRGMLENDLIITRYLDENEGRLTRENIDGLYQLMELSDNELWDIFSGRQEYSLPHLNELVDALRNIRLSSS